MCTKWNYFYKSVYVYEMVTSKNDLPCKQCGSDLNKAFGLHALLNIIFA